jgi:serine/threonine protein kinase
VRLYAGSEEMKRAFVDLAVLGACKCPFITQYYGYYIEPEHIHICMEPMATCFWKILEFDLMRQRGIPETAVDKVAFSVCKALEYLRSKHVIGRKFGDGKI